MSTSVPPGDGGTQSAIADESALKRLFDAHYAEEVESAKSQLGDATALAPRVVETAFANAWTQRATLNNDASVAAFLTDEVHHGSARALSRRAAAHRFGTHGGRDEPGGSAKSDSPAADAARSWAEIQKSIHAGEHSDEAHAAFADAGRKDAASHMKNVATKKSWVVPVALGVVVLAGLGAAGLYLDRAGEDDAILTAVGSTTLQPVITSNTGQLGNTTLSDSVKVHIGPDSKIFEPDGFPSKIHAIRFEGTAQFDVPPLANDKALKFHVIADKTHFIGDGASFVIYAYPADSNAMVLVKKGSVTVKNDKSTQVVGENQSLLVDASGMHPIPAPQQAVAFGWVDGKVTSNKHLRDAIATMTRWFNMDIKVPDVPLLDRDASFVVPLDSSGAAIAQIEKSANVKFGYEGETKAFRDAAAKKK
ncbi:MAG: hypothetical protein ABI442_19585 [Gemmatimonadaceae bacterium]